MMTLRNNNEVLINMEPKRELEISKELKISITIPKISGKISRVKVLFNKYGEKPSIIKEMQKTKEDENSEDYYTSVKFNDYGNFDFFFSFYEGNTKKAIKINRKTNKPFITTEEQEAPYWRILVIRNDFFIPQWAKNQIFYQIFVDRFYKSPNKKTKKLEGRNYRKWGELPNWQRNEKGDFHNNDFFGGNLKGIEEKLKYLKSLHVGVIYLSPINESLYRYDRYASTNHKKIDPDAGDFKDLKSLHEKANAMGMYIILDVALNHCSSDNPIFQKALENPDSKYRNWFHFDAKGNYKYWYNEFKDMPIFNQRNLEFQNYIYGEDGVIDTFSRYVDGFRLDVAEELQPFFLEGIRKRANKDRPHLIIAESWKKENASMFGKCFDGTTNYMFTNAILKYIVYGEYEYLKWQVRDIAESYPKNTIILNSLDTHDIVRALTILGGKGMRKGYDRIWDIDKDPSPWHINTSKGRIFLTDAFREFEFDNDILEKKQYEYTKNMLKLAVMIQYFLEGNPCIFYGTEVGLHGYKDPFNRKCFPWDNIDEELLTFYQKMGELRSHFHGDDSETKFLQADKDIFIFERFQMENSVFVAVNRSSKEKRIELPIRGRKVKHLFSVNGANKNILPPLGGIVVIV